MVCVRAVVVIGIGIGDGVTVERDWVDGGLCGRIIREGRWTDEQGVRKVISLHRGTRGAWYSYRWESVGRGRTSAAREAALGAE